LDDRESYFDRGCPNLVLLPYVHFGGTGLEGSAIGLLRQRIWQALQSDVGFNETPWSGQSDEHTHAGDWARIRKPGSRVAGAARQAALDTGKPNHGQHRNLYLACWTS